MTSPVEQIEVECPACGRVYPDWHRASVNLDLEGWDAGDPEIQQYLRECSTGTCPTCSFVVKLDTLVIDGHLWRGAN